MRKNQTLRDFKDILEQWDYEKNDSVDPLNIAAGSTKKYWFKCKKCGQSYLASPYKKTSRKYGCPICSNHLVITGVNDIKSKYPELMKDWDYSKNKNIDPSILSKGNLTKIYWKCHKCGHEWTRTIRDAVDAKINCPKCSKKASAHKKHLFELKKNGCLSDKELLKDWDYYLNPFSPSDVTPASNTYVHWKCHKCGYKWIAKLNNRTNGRGCPCCANKVLVKGKNDLETTHPELAKEWHPIKNGELKPSDVTFGMGKRVWWLCPNGHEYQTTVNHRTAGQGSHCPICNSGRQTSFREQALFYYIKKMYPHAISRYKTKELGKFEIDIYIPDINLGIEYDGIAWHKENKYEREQRKYLLCKEAGIHLLRVKEKMPEELGLILADEILSTDDFETEQGFTMVIHMVLERIDYSDFYRMHPLDVNLSRDRFEIMKYATEIKNSFADIYPDKAKEWHPIKNGTLKPSMFKPKSGFKAWWICPECGNEYEQSLNQRSAGSGCPKCALKSLIITRRKNLVKKNGGITNPLLIKEWDYEKNLGLKPEEFTQSSAEKVWWKCSKCGYEWKTAISNRTRGKGCPKCAGFKLFVGENDFATIHPDLLKEWDYSKNVGIDPHKIHHGTNISVWWKCSKCGHEWKAPVARRDKGAGCRKCADKANPELIRETLLRKNGSLKDICPNLVTEYSSDNVLPIEKVSTSSHHKVKWVCSKCGHEWEAAPYSRKAGSGCPICGAKKSIETRKRKAASKKENS